MPGGEVEYVVEGASSGVEVDNSFPIARAGKLVSLAINPSQNTLDEKAVFTVRVNGADTALQVEVPAFSTSVKSIVTDVNVPADALVSLELDTTLADPSTFVFFFATYEYQAD